MANAIVEIIAPSGMTLTLSLFLIGSDTAGASEKTLTERTNDKGTYRATIIEALVGLYRANALNATGVSVSKGLVVMSDAAIIHYVREDSYINIDIIDNIVLALFAAEGDTGITLKKAIEILAAFTSGKITVSSDSGISTYTYKKRDGSTTSFTSICSETTPGIRGTTGSLS